MKIKVFGCPSVKRELYYLASFCPNDLDIEIISPDLPQSLLQQRIDSADAERIILAFGQRRLEGLHSGSIPLVAPKAHDCAHLLLGSAQRYRRIFSENDDQPRWLNCAGCEISAANGTLCAVSTGLLPLNFSIPEGTREYIADLSMLKSILGMDFDDDQAVIIPPNSSIISDPVEIISFEAL